MNNQMDAGLIYVPYIPLMTYDAKGILINGRRYRSIDEYYQEKENLETNVHPENVEDVISISELF
jgi:hypothetical protein